MEPVACSHLALRVGSSIPHKTHRLSHSSGSPSVKISFTRHSLLSLLRSALTAKAQIPQLSIRQ